MWICSFWLHMSGCTDGLFLVAGQLIKPLLCVYYILGQYYKLSAQIQICIDVQAVSHLAKNLERIAMGFEYLCCCCLNGTES